MSGADWLNLVKLATSSGQKKGPTNDVAQKQSTPRNQKKTGGGSHGRSAAVEDGRTPKRPRKEKEDELRVDSPVFVIEDLNEEDYEHFKQDPLEFCGDLCKSASKVLKKLKIESSRAQTERDAAKRKLKEFEPQIASLEELKDLKTKLTEADNARVAAEKDKKLAEDDKGKVVRRNKELLKQVKSLQGQVARFEEEKEAAVAEKVQEVAGMARGAAVFQFENAVAQMKVFNAARGVQFDDKVVKPDHMVEGEEIVLPLKKDDEGKVVQKRSVVFSRPQKSYAVASFICLPASGLAYL